MNLSQRSAPTPGLAAGVVNPIVAEGLPHQLRDVVKVALAWPTPTRTIRGPYGFAMRAEPDDSFIDRGEGYHSMAVTDERINESGYAGICIDCGKPTRCVNGQWRHDPRESNIILIGTRST
jgi:hypothetical protein